MSADNPSLSLQYFSQLLYSLDSNGNQLPQVEYKLPMERVHEGGKMPFKP
jgi:hypothetical protein